MEVRKYMIFIKVAEMGNISKAAKELNYTQSAVSHVINDLEKTWGFPIIIRSKVGVKLTDPGNRMLLMARQLVRWETLMEQTASVIRGGETGTLRIGLFPGVASAWLPPIVKRFQEEHPGIEFEFGDCETIRNSLLEDRLDCGFIEKSYGEGLHFFSLYDDDYLVVLPENHPLSTHLQITAKDLKNEEFIMPDGKDSSLQAIVSGWGINVKYHMKDSYGVVALVEQGLGVSILPRFFLNNISGNIVVRPLDGDYYRTLGVALHTLKYSTPAAQLFIDYARLYTSNYAALGGQTTKG